MDDAISCVVLGVLVGFGLSLLLGFLGTTFGRLLAMFDV